MHARHLRFAQHASTLRNGKDTTAERTLLRETVIRQGNFVQANSVAYLAILVYFFVAVTGTSHEDLLRETPKAIPLLNIQLNLWWFFLMGPIAFVLVHINLLTQYFYLSRNLMRLDTLVKSDRDKYDGERIAQEHGLVANFTLSQLILDKTMPTGLRLFSQLGLWFFSVIAPLVLLYLFLWYFLPYHSVVATWVQRTCLLVDGVMIGYIWTKIISGERKKTLVKKILREIGPVITAFVLAVPLLLPGEGRFIQTSCEWSSLPKVLVEISTHTPIKYNLDLQNRLLIGSDIPPNLFTDQQISKVEFEDKINDYVGKHQMGLKLSERDLQGANLSGAKLYHASLSEAHIEGADLGDAHLEGADLMGAHLEGADLMGAHLEGTELNLAHLEGADLGRAHLEGADLWIAHLEGTDLNFAHLEGADLGRAHLEGAELGFAHLEGAELGGAHLEGADLRFLHLEGSYFQPESINACLFQGVHYAPLNETEWAQVKKENLGEIPQSLRNALKYKDWMGTPPLPINPQNSCFDDDIPFTGWHGKSLTIEEFLPFYVQSKLDIACINKEVAKNIWMQLYEFIGELQDVPPLRRIAVPKEGLCPNGITPPDDLKQRALNRIKQLEAAQAKQRQ
ncbi:pentapeptide repeat-containing protein [Pseudodesulfovibrio sp.]|uniref:pentapeptide repeat-containing protein n=1 Tax=unclassified Pseudodesulfovibrio TaxID=2661612 RepID=UPI003B00902E